MNKINLGNCLQRDNIDFPWLCSSDHAAVCAALSQAQQGPPCAQGADREETALHIRTSTTASKRPCFIDPTFFQANNRWAHLGIQWTAASEISTHAAQLSPTAQPLSCTWEDCAMQQLWLKRNCFSMGLEQQLAIKKGYCQVILRSLCKILSMKGSHFFSGQQIGMQYCPGANQPLCSPKVNMVLG